VIAERVVAVDEQMSRRLLSARYWNHHRATACRSQTWKWVAALFTRSLVDEDDDIFEIGRQHVRLVASLVAIEQQRPAVDTILGGIVLRKSDFGDDPLPERARVLL